MKHELKCWPEYFQAIWVGDKTFEIRKNDRGFQERDNIVLQEFDPLKNEYTGREIDGFIRYITNYAQAKDYIVMSIEVIGMTDNG